MKQIKPHVKRSILSESDICYTIDAEFASYSFYRLIEVCSPEMEIHVRNCAKISFDIEINAFKEEKRQYKLKCLIIQEPLESLKPVRVGWMMIDASIASIASIASARQVVSKDDWIRRRRLQLLSLRKTNPNEIYVIRHIAIYAAFRQTEILETISYSAN